MIEFFMPMKTPTTTFQAKKVTVKNGKPIVYNSEEVKKVKSLLLGHLSKHIPDKPLKGSVHLRVVWGYPIKGNHHDGELKTSKPDIDNIQKLLMDCMTELGFWKDDSQVCILEAVKVWARIPGIAIWINQEEEIESRN